MPQHAGNTIKSVQAFSTGTAGQHREHRYGSRLPQLWWVLTSRSWIKVPINVFVIEHERGLILFDTGLDPAIKFDPNYINSPIGRFLLKRIFQLEISAEDTLANKLEALGYRAADVQKALISHLHFDHIGGIADIPQADLLVNAHEWQRLSEPNPEREWMLVEHIKLPGARWQQIEFAPSADPLFAPFGGCHDVMGDGSLVLLPTPGHTPGSMSLLIRSGNMPPLLLIADLSYAADLLMEDRVPGTGDPDQLRSSFAKVRALKQSLPDLIILPSHDPSVAKTLKQLA